jgi:hypothetical protein
VKELDDARHNLPAPSAAIGRKSAASKLRTWSTTVGIAAVLLSVMYGVTTHRAEVKDEQRQAEMQHDANLQVASGQQPAH